MEAASKLENEIDKTCRTCMTTCEKMRSLFETIVTSESDFIYSDMIMACASVEVSLLLYCHSH